MSTPVRFLMCVGTVIASVAVGVVAARAVQRTDAAPPAAPLAAAPVLVGDATQPALPTAVVPVAAPVALGDDPSIGQQLVDAPASLPADALGPEIGRVGGIEAADGVMADPGAPDLSTAEPVDGTVPEPPGTDGTGTPSSGTPVSGITPVPLMWDAALLRLLHLPLLTFDVCAGAESRSDSPPIDGCPTGVGGTVLGLVMPPTPFMFASVGHYRTATAGGPTVCPTTTAAPPPGYTALTIFSVTPLDSLRVQWRPYGSSDEWQTVDVTPATIPEQAAAWNARLEREPFDRATWGVIPRCINIPRDPNQAYEVHLTATDSFGREVTANRDSALPDATPDLRPPTTAQALGVPTVASVTGWSTREGSVQFFAKPITDAADRTCGRQLLDERLVHRGLSASPPSPIGVWDPAYTQAWVAQVPMAPGGMTLLCATVYDSRNRLRPAGTDQLLLVAPTAQRPVITLEGFRLHDGVVVEPEDMRVVEQAPDGSWPMDGCEFPYTNTEQLRGGVLVQHALWECRTVPLPTDARGYVKVPITVLRDLGSEQLRSTWGIPIQLDDCSSACPPRPTEWYEVPVPSGSSVICGETWWSGGSCPQPDDGVAIVKVTYPLALGADSRYGTSTLLSRSDRPATDPPGTPYVTMSTGALDPRSPITAPTQSLTLFSDRRITLQRLSFTDALGGEDACSAPFDVAVGGAAGTEFTVPVTTHCLGWAYAVTAHFTDPAGHAYEQHVGHLVTPSARISGLSVRAAFLGGDVPALGYFYRFSMRVERGDAASSWAYRWDAARRGTSPSCMGLADTSVSSPSAVTLVHGTGLDVEVTMTITTTGTGDCSGSGRTGLGDISLRGSFSLAQLAAGDPLVLHTPADSRLQVRVTVTTTGSWLLVG